MIREIKDHKPNIHGDTFVAESADVIGNVILKEGSNIWFGAVLRGDINLIEIGKLTNVQDNATLHNDVNNPLTIGDYTTIGHNAVVHGCTIGDNCLIGMGAIILNGAIIGNNCLIGAGSLVTEGMNIPDNSLVLGSPGKIRREVSNEEIEFIRNNAINYNKLWKEKYR